MSENAIQYEPGVFHDFNASDFEEDVFTNLLKLSLLGVFAIFLTISQILFPVAYAQLQQQTGVKITSLASGQLVPVEYGLSGSDSNNKRSIIFIHSSLRNGLSYKNMERFMVEWRHWLMDFEYLISTPKFVYSQSDPDLSLFSHLFFLPDL